MRAGPLPRGLLHAGGSFLALDKPAGISMATAGRTGGSGEDVVIRLFEALDLETPDPLPLLVHRLDVGTSGVVLLAKDRPAHRRLSLAFQERRVEKTYRALVWGWPEPGTGQILLPLGRDPKDGRRMRVDPRGKPAATAYRTLRRYTALSDLAVAPRTGRTHQIRVHLASAGHPVAGDDLYAEGARWRGIKDPELREALASLGRPLLHAARLVCADLALDVRAPLPAEYTRLLGLLSRVTGSTRSRR